MLSLMDLEMSVCALDRCVLVELHGECDLTSALTLRERLLDVLSRQSVRVVADLSGLRFLDCAGADALVAGGRRASLLDGQLMLAAPAAGPARLLRLADVDRRLVTFPTVAAALTAAQTADFVPRPRAG